MTGKLITVASSAGLAGFNLPPGVAPTSPVNGDIWTTSAGLFVQINGSTVGPFAGVANPTGTVGLTTVNGSAATLMRSDAAPPLSQAIIPTWAGLHTFSAGFSAGNSTFTGTITAASLPTVGTIAGSLCRTSAGLILYEAGINCFSVSATSITVGSTTVASGSTGNVEFNNGGTLGEYAITGTGNVVMSASPTLTGTITAAAANFSGATTFNSTANVTGGFQINGTIVVPRPAGRLTLTSATPVMTASATAQTTLYYDCYAGGNAVPYYNGTTDLVDAVAACQVSDAMAASSTGVLNAAGVFDVWWVHGGANRICVATNGSGGGWASDTGGSNTARGTGYSQLDTTTRPYVTNKNAIANCYNGATNYGSVSANQGTYLGTICTDAAAAGSVSFTFGGSASGGTAGRFCVWNHYNRVDTATNVTDSGSNYTYTTATIRQARASAGNQVVVIFGQAEDATIVNYDAQSQTVAVTNSNTVVGIGVDSTTVFSSAAGHIQLTGTSVAIRATSSPHYMAVPLLGLHTFAALESGDGSNANAFDIGSDNTFSVRVRN